MKRGHADYQATQLVIEPGLELEAFEELLAGLGGIARGHQWWVGDAIVYAERNYGEATMAQASEHLQLEPHTLTNYAWVATKVEPSRRREKLSWSHHAEVARLQPRSQIATLTKAEKEAWTVRSLRDYVAITFPQPKTGSDPEPLPGLAPAEEEPTQKRLEEIESRWADADKPDAYGHRRRLTPDDVADVAWLLTLAKRLTRGAA